jgi:peptide/nickel transport system substrate-binding protein
MKGKRLFRHLILPAVFILLAATAGLVLAAPGGSCARLTSAGAEAVAPSTEEQAAPHNPATVPYTTLVDVTFSAPETMDPHWLYDTASLQVAAQVYETLLMQKREDPTAYIPLLATGWDIAVDGKTYTFTVRSAVRFHAGGTLQTQDVAYSFWRGLLQDRGSGPMWMLLWPLLNAYDVEDIPGDDAAKCQAVKNSVTYDDATDIVTFHLANACAPFLDILATSVGSVLDQEWMVANSDWGGDCADWRAYHNPPSQDSILYNQMNGTGPFRFVHWTSSEIRLDRYDGYWRHEPAWEEGPSGPPALETVLIKDESDWATRRDMLLGGDADTIYVPRTNVAELDPFVWGIYEGFQDRDPALAHPDTGTLRLFKDLPSSSQVPLLFCYNINADANPYIGSGALDGDGIPPDFFTDIHVRKAFNYAMDWSTVITDAYGGEAFRSRGPIPRGMLGYDEAQAVYEYNAMLSALEFQQAWGGQVWTQGFSLTLAYNDGNLTRQRILEILAQNLQVINPAFRLNVINLPGPDLLNTVGARRMPSYVGGWGEDYHHPHDWVQPYLHSEGWYAGYQGFPPAMAAMFDAQVDECIQLTDLSAAQACYEELQDMSYEQAAAAWGAQPIGRHYERTEVRGYYYNPARPPYYYALSKGPQPSLASVSATEDNALVFADTSGATTTLDIPAGAVSETSTIVYTPDTIVEAMHPGGFRLGGMTFDLQVCQGGECLGDYAFAEPVTLTLHYSDADVAGLIEDELYLYTWDGNAWLDVVTDCGLPLTAYERHLEINELVVPACHFSRFALVGGTYNVYLPLVTRNH